MDKISVIVPVYNAERYLKRCVESILMQTYSNLEVILVDDGSTDNSGKICDDYLKVDSRVRVIHKANGGVSSARNYGLEVAIGKYVTFVDSDDWIENDAIEILYNLLVKNKAECSCFSFYIDKKHYIQECKQNGNTVKVLDSSTAIEFALSNNKFSGYVWNKLYSLHIIREKAICFDENISICEDLLFNIKYLVCCNKVIYNNIQKYHYFYHEESALKSKFNSKKLSVIIAYEEISKIVELFNDKLLTNTYSSLVSICIPLLIQAKEFEGDNQKYIDLLYKIIKKYFRHVMFDKTKMLQTKLYAVMIFISPKMFYYIWRKAKNIKL